MNIVVINGTSQKGLTNHMKEMFLSHFGETHVVTEFYPQDLPAFCTGCKNCFIRGESLCPHAKQMTPIWNTMLSAQLIVFAYPVYALRAPASIKSLLDHLCVHWMVHRPDERMFSKTVVVITNSIGAPNGAAQKDVRTSFSWMGVSRIYTCGAGMMGDIFLDTLSSRHEKMLNKKTARLYQKVKNPKSNGRMKVKERILFFFCKQMHAQVLKSEETPSLDNQYYLDHGWIRARQRR